MCAAHAHDRRCLRARRYSWGGGLALAFAVAVPDAVTALVLFHVSCVPPRVAPPRPHRPLLNALMVLLLLVHLLRRYTEQHRELEAITSPAIVIWVPEDQVHPRKLGAYIARRLPDAAFVELPRRVFAPGADVHAWEARAEAETIPAVMTFLARRCAARSSVMERLGAPSVVGD
jgi:pimeloyl-ACP methyl ester carboxylesterase